MTGRWNWPYIKEWIVEPLLWGIAGATLMGVTWFGVACMVHQATS